MRPEFFRPGMYSYLIPRVLPMLILGSIVGGVGELFGYAFGIGNAKDQMWSREFHRYRHLLPFAAKPKQVEANVES